MTRLKSRPSPVAPAAEPTPPDVESGPPVRPPLRHMELSLADIERILDPHYTPEQAARRQRLFARADLLGDLTSERLKEGVKIDLEALKNV